MLAGIKLVKMQVKCMWPARLVGDWSEAEAGGSSNRPRLCATFKRLQLQGACTLALDPGIERSRPKLQRAGLGGISSQGWTTLIMTPLWQDWIGRYVSSRLLLEISWRNLVYLLKQHTALYLDKVKFVREPRRSDNAHKHIHLPLSLCSLHSHTNNKHVLALVCVHSLLSVQFTMSLGNPRHCWQFFLLDESVGFTVFENSASCMIDRTVTRRGAPLSMAWSGLVVQLPWYRYRSRMVFLLTA